jgi:hypothetical protein
MNKIELKNQLQKVFYTIEYNKEKNWLYSNWIGYISVEDVKTGANKAIEVIAATKCGNVLNDNRQVTGPWSKANDWIANDWMPRALKTGLRNFAMVTSPNLFGEMSAKELETRLDSIGFVMRNFKDYNEAAAWLTSQMKPSGKAA